MVFELVATLLSLGVAAAAWLFPDWSWYYKVIFTLGVVICCISMYCIRSFVKLRKEAKKLADVEQRHDALSAEYTDRIELCGRYRRAFHNMSIILHIACQNSKEAKLSDIYREFLAIQEQIDDNGGM